MAPKRVIVLHNRPLDGSASCMVDVPSHMHTRACRLLRFVQELRSRCCGVSERLAPFFRAEGTWRQRASPREDGGSFASWAVAFVRPQGMVLQRTASGDDILVSADIGEIHAQLDRNL